MTQPRARATYSSTAAAGSALQPTLALVPRDAAELLRGCEMSCWRATMTRTCCRPVVPVFAQDACCRTERAPGPIPDCAVFAADLVKNGTRTLVLAHLSEKNNMLELARQQTLSALRGLPACEVLVAPKEHMGASGIVWGGKTMLSVRLICVGKLGEKFWRTLSRNIPSARQHIVN